MNLDGKIKEAFTRHENDVDPRPGAWREVESRIGRSHRRRLAAAGIGVAIAIAGFIVVAPRLGNQQIVPDTSTWTEFRSARLGVRLLHPQSWSLSDSGGIIEVAPQGLRDATGNTDAPFRIRITGVGGTYNDPRYPPPGSITLGRIGNRPFLRADVRRTPSPPDIPAVLVTYGIDWRGPACPPGQNGCVPVRTLIAEIVANTSGLWDRFSDTAERIIQTIRPLASGSAHAKPERPRVVGKIRANASALAAGSDSLWALEGNAASDTHPATLLRIDPLGKTVLARIAVGDAPQAVAADSDAIWVTNGSGCGLIATCGDASQPPTFRFPYLNSVMRIDPRTDKVVASIPVEDPQDVAVGFGSVWVTSRGGAKGGTTVRRIDPNRNRVIATIRLADSGPGGRVAVGTRFVFVTVPRSRDQAFVEFSRIDPATNEATPAGRLMSGSTLPDLATGFDSVWLTTADQSTASALFRIDEGHNLNTGTIPLPDAAPVGLNAVTTGDGYVWAVSARGYLWKVDPTTREHSDPTTIGDTPPDAAEAVVTGFGFVWVASSDGQIWQLSP